MKRILFRFSELTVAIAISFASLGLFSGCTKKQESSSITVSMPDWSKLTSKQQGKSVGALSKVTVVSRVMINITGPDIQNPAVYVWELGDYGAARSIPTPPAEHTLTVPRGSNRLIQVLAILEEMDTEGGGGGGPMTFYYGDTVKSIANSVEPVSITLSQSATSSGDGSISGRHFFADGSTPTGPVDMYFAPAGKRPMIVESTSIFSGHFHFYLLPTVPFTFRMRESGIPLFENVTVGSFTSQASDRLLQIAVPAGFRDFGGGGIREPVGNRTKVVGFTGPGAGIVGRSVCYPTPTGPLAGFYDAATGGAEVLWNSASGLATEARILGGGIGTADGQCSTYTETGVNSFEIWIDDLTNGDSPIGNRGPFTQFDLGGGRGSSHLDVTEGVSNLVVKWSYLAGVVGQSVDGVGIFYKVFAAGENIDDRWHDNAPCNQLPAMGFTEVTRVAAGDPADPTISYTWTNANLTAFNSGR